LTRTHAADHARNFSPSQEVLAVNLKEHHFRTARESDPGKIEKVFIGRVRSCGRIENEGERRKIHVKPITRKSRDNEVTAVAGATAAEEHASFREWKNRELCSTAICPRKLYRRFRGRHIDYSIPLGTPFPASVIAGDKVQNR